MYKLYFSPGACSLAPHVILHELGVPHEAIKLDIHAGAGQKPDFLKLNPRGQVPLLIEEDGTPIKEGAAIILHLLEKHDSPLLPKSGIGRAKAVEWLMWCNATLHPAYGKVFWLKRAAPDNADLMKMATDHVQKLWDEADAQLAKTPYLAGKTLTAADILMAVIANWGIPNAPTLGANVKRVLGEVAKRPSFKKAIAHEQVEYKAAA
jgi:glutathione S-transferase